MFDSDVLFVELFIWFVVGIYFVLLVVKVEVLFMGVGFEMLVVGFFDFNLVGGGLYGWCCGEDVSDLVGWW